VRWTDVRVWRPRLWVRMAAVIALLSLAAMIAVPQAFNPDWTQGLPSDQLPWAIGMIGLAGLFVWCVWTARVEVDSVEVRVIHPWGVRRIPTTDIEEVRPGRLGVEFLDRHGNKTVGFAVQATAAFSGQRPRWVDIAEVVTGTVPDWQGDDDDQD
jgi:hypothetical protein